MRAELIQIQGGFWNAYILRTLSSSEFNYESAKGHLMNLDLGALGTRTMQFSTVTEEEAVDLEVHQHKPEYGQARLMCLATWINLESRISVSPYVLLYSCS